jgi:serine/threonine protein kinase/Flp pilus assembly protein TadD
MTPERWQQINRLWDAALELEGDERSVFLAAACAGDEALRAEVESLLAAHQQANSFIETPPSEAAEDLIADGRARLISHGIGPYQVMSELGRGGMGEVYLARDTRLGRHVALKLLPAEFTRDEDRVRRFEQEARATSALNHPNILTVYEIGKVDDVRFIATEFIEGETLSHRLARASLELREVLDIAMQTAGALAAAHQVGIVHRDIKPENIMLRPDGYVKVLDFGIAKLIQREALPIEPEAPAITSAGMLLGTISYMSPEQAQGLPVDARTDIFSLGVVLYEMVAGHKPFAGESSAEVLVAILDREPPPLARFRQEAPRELQQVVNQALRKNREARYQTINDLLIDLKQLRDELEFNARLGRPASPNSASRAAAAMGIEAALTTIVQSTVRSHAAPTALTPSTTASLIGAIKPHKRGAAFVIMALLLSLAGLSYFFYSAKRAKAQLESVAVLPFVNVSNDPNMEYLSDGISESLINRLSPLPQLKVIARTSTLKYKHKEIEPQVVAKELGVQAIVTGRVLLHNDNLQISVELMNAEDKMQLWGEQYNRKAADLQAVQEEIARKISEKLRLRLTGLQEQQLTKRATQNPEAYQLYLSAIYLGRKGGNEDLKKALGYFNQATVLDPNFAQAYANMVVIYINLAANSVFDPKEAMPKAKAAAQKALELDGTLAEAHAALAIIKINEWDWTGAESEYRQALELNPNLAAARSNYANYLSIMGRDAEALGEIKRAQDIDPARLNFRYIEGRILLWARRYDEAIQTLQNIIALQPDFGPAHEDLGYCYDAKGLYAEAIATYQKLISVDKTPSLQVFLGYALAMSGNRKEALALLNELKATKEYVSPAELAILYAGLGDKERALEALEKAYAAHDLQLQYLKVEPRYDSLRSDRRFIDLLRRVGFAP